ncbi:helix-turn-helix domain-containing protein [Neobacillus drentensis]|uniref:helix-turn-helix domain-containing protein n=1 Tax=Neobacillus drentensis TaxID=220684 RepID=UPI002FFFE712
MQDYLNVALLVINFIAVLYLVSKSSLRKKLDYQQELHLKMLSNQEKMIHQISELKGMMEQNQIVHQLEYEQWKEEIKVLGSSIKAVPKSTSGSGQHLFLNDRYKEIFDLQDKGLTAEEIAKELGKGCGEVTFILQLADQARS